VDMAGVLIAVHPSRAAGAAVRGERELGIGDDLALPGRDAIRTPMQFSATPGGGFSASPEPNRLVVHDGQSGYETVNVTAQRHDPARCWPGSSR
jgi:maltose alpha-D-glucosyltransferase/alpha-amylase